MHLWQAFPYMLLLVAIFAAEQQQQTPIVPFYGHNPDNAEQRNLLALESLSAQTKHPDYKDNHYAYQSAQNQTGYNGYENNYQLYFVPIYQTKRQPELQDGRRKLDSLVDVNQQNALFYEQQQHQQNPSTQEPGYQQGQPQYVTQVQYYEAAQQQTQEYQPKLDAQQYQVQPQIYTQQSESQEHQAQQQQQQQQQQLQHQYYVQPNQQQIAQQHSQQQQPEHYLYPEQQLYQRQQQKSFQLQQLEQQQQQLNLYNTAPNVFPAQPEAYQLFNNYQDAPQQLFYPQHTQQHSGHLGQAQTFFHRQPLAYAQQTPNLHPHLQPYPHPLSLPHQQPYPHSYPQPHSFAHPQQSHAYQAPHPSTVSHFDAPFRPSQFAGYSHDPPTANVHGATHARRDSNQQTWQPIALGQHYHRYVKPIHESPRESAPNVSATDSNSAQAAENATKYVYMSPQNIYALFKSRHTRNF